jgi:oligoendopeptidase F
MPFVPHDLDPADLDRVEPLYQELIERPLESPAALESWLLDASALEAVVDEHAARRHIAHTRATDDEAVERAYLQVVEVIEPRLKPWKFKIQQKLVHSEHARGLDPGRFDVLLRSWRNALDLYREENIPLETQEAKLFTEYSKITAAMTVELRGETLTLQQAAKLLEEPDRAARQEAWELTARRRERDRAPIDDIFSELLRLRERIARNAGFDTYRDYAFRRLDRFDYTPEDCLRFGDTIAELCLPLVERLDDARRQALGVERLRPWDLAVDPYGAAPLRPFGEGEIPRFIEGTREVFARISPELGERFSRLRPGENLDLESRKGKRPGGYQASLEVVRQPFIFMNAVGTERDLETLLHEGGHALHYLDASVEPLIYLRHAPLEFCEVASMGMELLGSAELDVFYAPVEAARARRTLLEGIVRFLPWMATIDGFQHWLYVHPGHTAAERREAWLAVQRRFTSSRVDWSGHEETLAWRWQPQLHVFGMPFYYIEYGFAQLGALQLWQRYRHDPAEALARLRRAFALGGSRPLPELFAEAGLRFDVSPETLGPLLEAVASELRSLTTEIQRLGPR